MSIKFKAIEKGQPGVVGGGEKKWYAVPVNDGEVTLEDVTEMIEEASTVSGADIRAVLYATVSVIIKELAKGRIVRVGDLGSLRISIKSSGEALEGDVDVKSIKGASVIFAPGTRIKDMLSGAKFNKA